MAFKKRLMKVVHNPKLIFAHLLIDYGGSIPDKKYMEMLYYCYMGKKLDLEHPQTFNEKLQWLKLNCREPEFTVMVDKVKAKDYIAEKIGSQYIIPTYGVWDDPDDIDFDKLPDQFVLKCNHGSGGNVICRDKSKLDIKSAKKKLRKGLNSSFYKVGREWAYKDVPHKILAEKFLVDETGWDLKDYKIFCFNGKPTYVEVDFNRSVSHKLNPYDFDWNLLDFCDDSPSDPNANIPKPKKLKEMIDIAATLSKDMLFLRVDFYSIYDDIYVGELTLYPGSGYIQFKPMSTDLKLGKLLKLPTDK